MFLWCKQECPSLMLIIKLNLTGTFKECIFENCPKITSSSVLESQGKITIPICLSMLRRIEKKTLTWATKTTDMYFSHFFKSKIKMLASSPPGKDSAEAYFLTES